MKSDAKQLTEQFKTILEKLQAGYKDIERQINTGFDVRDTWLREQEMRIKALEERVKTLEGKL
jgi:polyhydroxyalkanoate synthesis regulator phasin